MIDAGDLTTAEVRAQYVLPLVREIAAKSGLLEHAAAMGVDVDVSPPPSASAPGAPAQAPPADGTEAQTLFQEIATALRRNDRLDEENDTGACVSASPRCYAELLEESAALCAYLTPQESALVATVATSCLLAFLIPQCHFRGFLHSYYARPPGSTPKTAAPSSLDERLVNATLSNHNGTSGGVFPYSASRMGSLVADDDGFTTASFHRFLVQGLRPFLSSGMGFGRPSRDDIGWTDNDAIGDGTISCDAVLLQSGADLVQLLAMAICPNPPSMENSPFSIAATPASLSMEADKGAGGEQIDLEGVARLANSTMPFSFQLSYLDRSQLVRLCQDLVIPESEDGTDDVGDVVEANATNEGSGDNTNNSADRGGNPLLGASLHQLRSSLFGFASFNAHSDEDAKAAYKALVDVAMTEGNATSIKTEFQRLVQAALDSRSEYLSLAIGDCLVEVITQYNESRFYADASFVRYALGLIGKSINERIRMSMTEAEKCNRELTSSQYYDYILEGNAAKRQKIDSPPSSPNKWKSYHVIALLKATEPLFYFLLDSNTLENQVKDEELSGPDNAIATIESLAKSQLIRDVSILLCYPSSMPVVRSAAKCLALALSYTAKYLADRTNVRHLFRFTRLAVVAHRSADGVEALRPLVMTASRQSKTYAVSLLSFAIKTFPENRGMAWKIASLISSASPSVVSRKLAELNECTQGSEESREEVERDEIMTRLSCTMTSYSGAPSTAIEQCTSLAKKICNHWTLYQLVRFSFITSNFGFAHRILVDRQLPNGCSRSQTFLWLTILSKMAHAEEILGTKGAAGISESLEELNSCHSTLLSLAAMEQSTGQEVGKFRFQLSFLRFRIDFLNLCMTTRSLCSEIVLTGRNGSARTGLLQKNTTKSFGMLKSQMIDVYQLFGLHNCQQTRSVLRTFITLCQLMSDLAGVALSSESEPSAVKRDNGATKQQEKAATGNDRCPLASLVARLQSGVLEKVKDGDRLQAQDMPNTLDTVIRCPMPFPRGFFQVKPIPCCCVNLSAGPELLPKRQSSDTSANPTEAWVIPGLPFKLVLSGVIPEEFIKSADVGFSEIIAWKSLHYEGQLYDDDETEEVLPTNRNDEEVSDPISSTLRPCGEFIVPMLCEPVMREGLYRVKVKVGCRDVRCGEWEIPTKQLDMLIRVEEYSE